MGKFRIYSLNDLANFGATQKSTVWPSMRKIWMLCNALVKLDGILNQHITPCSVAFLSE